VFRFADVISLVTGMSDMREYVKEGKVVKMTIVEVTDDMFVC